MKTNASDDRKFVNSLFDATFENTQWNTMFPSEKNDKKKVKDKFATTAEYAVIKGKCFFGIKHDVYFEVFMLMFTPIL